MPNINNKIARDRMVERDIAQSDGLGALQYDGSGSHEGLPGLFAGGNRILNLRHLDCQFNLTL